MNKINEKQKFMLELIERLEWSNFCYQGDDLMSTHNCPICDGVQPQFYDIIVSKEKTKLQAEKYQRYHHPNCDYLKLDYALSVKKGFGEDIILNKLLNKMLKKMEWSKTYERQAPFQNIYICPLCAGIKPTDYDSIITNEVSEKQYEKFIRGHENYCSYSNPSWL